MVSLTHIPFAIFDNIVLLGCLFIVFKLIESTKVLNARKLFIFSVAFQFIATIGFIYSLFSTHQIPVPTFNSSLFSNFTLEPLNISEHLYFYIGIGYFLAVVLLLIRMLWQLSQLHQLRNAANFSEAQHLQSLLFELPISVPTNIKIGFSNIIHSPMVFGYIEPVILLPFSICNHLSTNEVKLVLMHEMAHILRNDYLINIFVEFTQLLLWFNPFAYLMIQSIQLQREIACDEFVVEYTNQPINYSKALLQIATVSSSYSDLSLSAVNSKSQLLTRVQKINGIFKSSLNKTLLLGSFLFLLILTAVKVNISNSVFKEHLNIVDSDNGNKGLLNQGRSIIHKSTVLATKAPSVSNIQHKYNTTKNQALNTKDFDKKIAEHNNLGQNLSYNDLLIQTKEWIKEHENPVQLTSYDNLNAITDFNDDYISKDSVYTLIADKLLINSIIKSYQLKKAILAKRLENAKNKNEANDYLYNSKEWEEIVQYEKWASEFLKRNP